MAYMRRVSGAGGQAGQAMAPGSTVCWARSFEQKGTPGRDGRKVAVPYQQTWAASAVAVGDSLSSLPIDVHLYVRGGPWLEQFAKKLVGEAGGNRHLSSIYVSGELRERGEREYRARLEAKGWTLPDRWQCDEWVLYQRQGENVMIKLAYTLAQPLEGVCVYLEAKLTDSDIWWSLPVWVDTGNEPVHGIRVAAGIFCPSIEGQQVAIGIANRGPYNVAVMPAIDGRNLLKAPYFLSACNGQMRDEPQAGPTFATFPGLQAALQSKNSRTQSSFKKLEFMRTAGVESAVMQPDAEQGMLKVKVYRTKKIIWKTDPERMLEQLEQMRDEVAAAPMAASLAHLKFAPGSKELLHYDTYIGSTSEEVKEAFGNMAIPAELHSEMGEVVINYRSLSWFREAHAAKQRASSNRPLPVVAPAPPALQVPSQDVSPTTGSAASPAWPSNDSPDSITPSGNTKGLEPVQMSAQPGQPSERRASVSGSQATARQRTKAASQARSLSSRGRASDRSSSAVSGGDTVGGSTRDSSISKQRKLRELSPSHRLLQPSPRQVRPEPAQLPSFSDMLRNSSDAVTTTKASMRVRDMSPVAPNLRTAARVRDRSPGPNGKLQAASSMSEGDKVKEAKGQGRTHVENGGRNSTGSRRRSVEPAATPVKLPEPPQEDTTAWVVPKVAGRTDAFQKDEIVLRAGLRNVANLRRQIKEDLAPLLDRWSTAELVVKLQNVALEPDTLLNTLPSTAGSAAKPFVIEAVEGVASLSHENGTASADEPAHQFRADFPEKGDNAEQVYSASQQQDSMAEIGEDNHIDVPLSTSS